MLRLFIEALGEEAVEGMEEGWGHLGANNMFNDEENLSGDVKAIFSNSDLASGVELNDPNCGPLVKSASFEGGKGQRFMDRMGYEFMPTQQIRFENTSLELQLSVGPVGRSVTTGRKVNITEKSKYLAKGSMEYDAKPMELMSSPPSLKSLGFSIVGRYEIKYTNNSYAKAGLTILNNYGNYVGQHDLRPTRTYSNWNLYPGNEPLINKARNTWGD